MVENQATSSVANSAQISSSCHHAAPCAVSNGAKALIGQEVCHRSPLTDEARELAIVRAGRAIEKHMAEWHHSGCFAAHGDADRARRLMELLIAGRSPEQVAKMKAAQAERMTREPGAEKGAA